MIAKSINGKQPDKKFWRMWSLEICTLSRAPITLWLADQANSIISSTWQADNHRHIFRLSDSKMNLEFPSGQPLVSSPVACAKFCCNHCYRFWMRTNRNFYTLKKLFVPTLNVNFLKKLPQLVALRIFQSSYLSCGESLNLNILLHYY